LKKFIKYLNTRNKRTLNVQLKFGGSKNNIPNCSYYDARTVVYGFLSSVNKETFLTHWPVMIWLSASSCG